MFFALLRAGLWETEVCLRPYEPLDMGALYELAGEQSVEGIVALGLEHVADRQMTKAEVLAFLKKAVSLEGRNKSMDEFIERIIGRLDAAGIQAVLVKGQGVAQCYARPEWRSAGDVDLLLDGDNYLKAKEFLSPLASEVEKEEPSKKHLGMHFGKWVLELHGSLRSSLGRRVNDGVDEIQREMFSRGDFRRWSCGAVTVLLPSVDNDLFVIFTHILQHFFTSGIGLRQICDLCRLLWTYRAEIDLPLLERRLRDMGLMSEWKAFGAVAVEYLGMPAEAMPFYEDRPSWKRKAARIVAFILEVGNFGHNRDLSYMDKYPVVIRKAISFRRNTRDFLWHLPIFPKDAWRIYLGRIVHGFQAVARGE